MKLKHNSISKSLLGLSRLLVRGLCPGILAFAPAAWAETVIFNTPGTTTWTVPDNVTSVTVDCRGGGGAGGGVVANAITTGNANSRGSGGTGGNFARTVVPVTPGQQYQITVGGGGVSTSTSFTIGSQLPEQTGGSSKFSTISPASDLVVATGGLGGRNNVRLEGNATPNQGSVTAVLTGTVGNITFTGGSSGGAWGGTLGSGTGGGGAGDAANGGAGVANNATSPNFGRGIGGNAGGGDGAIGVGLNNPGNAGNAPGGGGSGAARNQNGTSLGGAGGAGSVTLTFAVQTGVTKYAVTGISPQTVTDGVGFDITITAQDDNGATVPDGINIVTMTSPTSGSLMEFDWDFNGVFDDPSGQLVAGVKTIRARNKKAQTVDIVASTGAVTTPVPLSMTTNAGAYATLQLLAPGETAAPGTATGKSGTATARSVGTEFFIDVNAVDAFWNRVDSGDEISITSTDGSATLPTNDVLVGGTINLPVTFISPGIQTLTASNVTDGTTSSTTPNITVNAIAATWVGDGSANVWDNDNTFNWLVGGGSSTFSANYGVTFNDTGSIAPAVDIVGSVSPHTVTVNNSASFPYTFTNGSITGAAGGFNKSGVGTLILANANTYTGPTTLSGGGLLMLQNVSALPATSALTLNVGVIGLNAGDFTRALGTSAGQVNITGNFSGFAAYGANRALNFGGASAPVTWGSGNFMHDGPSVQSSFLLSRADATHTLDFQNPVVLSGVRFFNVPNGGAAVDAVLSGAITGTTTFSKAGSGTLALTNTGNAWTGITYIDDGVLTLGASEVIPGAMVIKKTSTAVALPIAERFVSALDLNGFNETITTLEFGDSGGSSGAGNAGQTPELRNTGLSTATVTVTGTITYQSGTGGVNAQATISANLNAGTGTRTINVGDGASAVDLLISGSLTGESINKTGLGVLSISSPNHTGNTTATAGTLTLGAANPNNDASTVTIATDAILDLNYAGTDTVTGLVVNGAPLGGGVYGAAQFPGVITGTGTITVDLPVSDPFDAWSDGAAFDADKNNDGVDNGLAWLLGAANPDDNAVGLLPDVSEVGGGLTLSFSMLEASGRDSAVLVLEHSSDLGISDPWTSVTVSDVDSGPTSGVLFDVTAGSPVNNVNATISASQAAAGKLFGRVKAQR